MDFTGMDKKTLKETINENGFFVKMNTNRIGAEQVESILEAEFTNKASRMTPKSKIPKGENILFFNGLASQSYKAGEKNRNGYRIETKGWDLTNYKNNPVILLQHNPMLGAIGKTIMLEKKEEGLAIMYYIDLNAVENETTRYQLKEGLIAGMSTGSMALEGMFEDTDSLDMMTYADAVEKYSAWEVLLSMWGMSDKVTYVVTKSEMIENSAVTIGSNGKAVSEPTQLTNFLMNSFGDKEEMKPFIGMTRDQIEAKMLENSKDDEEAEEEEEAKEEPKTEAGKKADMLDKTDSKTTETISEDIEADNETTEEVEAVEEKVEEETNQEETNTPVEETENVDGDVDSGAEDIASETPSENAMKDLQDAYKVLVDTVALRDVEITELKNQLEAQAVQMDKAAKVIEEKIAYIENANEFIARAQAYTDKLGEHYIGDSELVDERPTFKNKIKKAISKS